MRDDEGQTLKKWLAESQNREAILEAAGLWHSKDVQSLLFALTGVSPQRRRPVARPRTLLFPLVVALVSTGTLVWMITGAGPRKRGAAPVPAAPSTRYSTAIGETRQIELADGTLVTLNTNTLLRVTYSQRAREVTLKRGEATFNVASERVRTATALNGARRTAEPNDARWSTARPFNVIAGQRTFQAQGTQFNLRTLPDNVDLIVIEGQVRILDARPREPTTPARRRDALTYGEQTISAFQEALVDPGFQSVSPIDAGEVQVRLAWQKGMIIFNDEALEDALAEIERYTPTKFVLADAKLGTMRVSGRFRTGNVNAVRLALRQSFFVASRWDTRGRIVLSPDHTAPMHGGACPPPCTRTSAGFLQRQVDRHVHEAGMQLQLGGRHDAGVVERDRTLPEVDVLRERDLVALELAVLDRQRAAVRPEARAGERRAFRLERVGNRHGTARRVDRAAPVAVDVRREGGRGGE